jgi:Costars
MSQRNEAEAAIDHEISLLLSKIKDLGAPDAEGHHAVAFGVLYDATVDIFEALGGTLKAAKKRGFISYNSPLLLKGAHDKVVITLLKE